jgi:dTDP-4-dehydrorhamnose reductase
VESDAPHPLGVYGESKLAGEQSIQAVGGNFLIFRTAWVFSTRRDSFVGKVLQWSRQQPTLKVVDDQVSNPTWARSLAEITALVIARGGAHPISWLGERANLYHLAGDGYASRLEWARAILDFDPQPAEQMAGELLPARTFDFPTPAQRPLFSALDCGKFFQTFGLRLPSWQDALRLAMQNS